MKVSVLKYFSHGSFMDAVQAQEKVNRLLEKHPDREYVILSNMRARGRFTVAQYKAVTVDLPSERDLGLPPAPEPPPLRPYRGIQPPDPAWEDYQDEVRHRRKIIRDAHEPLLNILKEKLNP